nr:tigger transposable element-derived protein 4-like [Rhipicephalus microplus]XP_037290254.1 tigger transposable element-derived protein 4-like [Rhipicephalus microplus]
MSGTEKLPMLVIGKLKAPRCFKGVKFLPVLYEADKKSWVTQQLFESYVRILDRKFDLEGRKIVDNCAAHGHITNLKAVPVEFLPPNTTSVLQPMDHGVIRTLKVNYRSRLLPRAVVCLNSGKACSVDLLGALSMLANAWKSMASTTLRNCFRHTGFVLNRESAALDEDSVAEHVLGSEQLINDLCTAGVDISSDVLFSEFACVDNDLELCAGLMDEEIIRQVLAESESDEDDDLPATAQLTQAELMQAIATLSSAYSDSATLPEMRAQVLAPKRSMVQKMIDHFFRPPSQ